MGKALNHVSCVNNGSGPRKESCHQELVVAEEQKGRGGPCKRNGDKEKRAESLKKKKTSPKKKVTSAGDYLNRFKKRTDLDLFTDKNGSAYISVRINNT